MAGITTLCFAASYAVALVLELARLGWRSPVRNALAFGFAAAGLVAETLYLGYRAATAETVPLASAYEWYLLAAWTLVAVYLYLAAMHSSVASGVFILPLALALIAAARYASRQAIEQSSAATIWVTIHATCWLLGAVAVSIGFAMGVMYLLQANRLKHKLPPLAGFRLPSLEWLERANSRAIVVSALMAGAGLASGVVLNMVKHKLSWSDATVWRSVGFFGWLLAAALFSALYRPARRGRKMAYLTVASFVFLAIFLAAQLSGGSEHEPVSKAGGRRSEVGSEKLETPVASADIVASSEAAP
jgi:ABC-type uncharacterized transport system permease subunit